MENTGKKTIWSIRSEAEFRETALNIFRLQYSGNPIYRRFTDALGIVPSQVMDLDQIPFLPIGFFRTEEIKTGPGETEKIFISSGTTRENRSRHFVNDLSVYRHSLLTSFEYFYGSPGDYEILALTPSAAENPSSSLVFMINELFHAVPGREGSWYLNREDELAGKLELLRRSGKKTLLIGITYALLDFSERFRMDFPGLVLMETGGMKGRKKEMIREELHALLKERFGVPEVHSEYGMTELLSQAYSKGDGRFSTPPWMRVLIRDLNDPLTRAGDGQAGGINIIDLANINSCSFIETQDLGRTFPGGTFEVLGRFENSDLRGCSLMAV